MALCRFQHLRFYSDGVDCIYGHEHFLVLLHWNVTRHGIKTGSHPSHYAYIDHDCAPHFKSQLGHSNVVGGACVA